MENLKIRVANEAESKEAQELFFELGYYWAYKNLGKKLLLSKKDIYLFAESDGTLGTGTHQDEVFLKNWRGKEITLQELRDMVNPMKEYLEKQADGSYKLVMRGIVGKDDDIEVPEGSEVATICGNYIIFWKDEKYSFSVSEENKWCYKSCDDSNYFSLGEYMNEYGDVEVIWQRHTQPEELPFMDSLNDQYAEIEQVRKQTIEATLAERQAQYGCFEDVARTTGKIMEALSEVRTNGLNDLPYPHRMALYMIASKMARIVNGDYNHKDSWHDIGGYSKLIEDLL